MATIGTILIQAANQGANLTGGGTPSMPGMGGGDGRSDAEADKRAQNEMRTQLKKQTEQGEDAPKFWTSAFKKMGIQMGLSGILKQSQIFTSTVGSLFQLLGAFVDVILAPFVPMFIPAMCWLARQLPNVAKAAQATAEGVERVVKSVWNWFTGGKLMSTLGGLFTTAVEGIKTAFGWLLDNPFTNWVADVTSGMFNGIKDWYKDTLAGRHVSIGKAPMIGSIGFTFPGGGGGNAGGGEHRTVSEENADIPKEDPPKSPSLANQLAGWNPMGDDEFSTQDVALTTGLVAGIGTAVNTATSSVKLGESEKWQKSRLGGNIDPQRNPNLDVGPGRRIVRTGVGGWVDNQQMNPLRRIPFAGLANKATAPIAVPTKFVAKTAANIMLGSGKTMAEVMGMPGFTGAASATDDVVTKSDELADLLRGPQKSTPMNMGGGDDFVGPGRNSFVRSTSHIGDDFVPQQGPKRNPTQLSDAVQKFNRWVQNTQRGMKNASGAGANAFKSVYDEGLSLADDVVNLAAKVPGMNFVGQIVSVGFKKVIPGVAGVYMVGETIQDMMKIIKADVPWLGEWNTMQGYTSEFMGNIFAEGSGPGGVMGMGLLGKPTEWLGNLQSSVGLGTGISDWQDMLTQAQDEHGVLAGGKLGDLVVRAASGFGGAALSTFFPGLGTLAGTALYEGGRMGTTGINLPGVDGTIGGNVERYGEAQDFSDQIIRAIEFGWDKGVNDLGVR